MSSRNSATRIKKNTNQSNQEIGKGHKQVFFKGWNPDGQKGKNKLLRVTSYQKNGHKKGFFLLRMAIIEKKQMLMNED